MQVGTEMQNWMNMPFDLQQEAVTDFDLQYETNTFVLCLKQLKNFMLCYSCSVMPLINDSKVCSSVDD